MKEWSINIQSSKKSRFGLSAVIFIVAIFVCSLMVGCGSVAGLIDLKNYGEGGSRKVAPLVILCGSTETKFSIERFLSGKFRTENSYKDLTAEIDMAGSIYKLSLEGGNKGWGYAFAGRFATPGWADIVLRSGGNEVLRLTGIVRVIDKFKITLTFDDGPAVDKNSVGRDISNSPTVITLDGLSRFVHGEGGSKRGINAAFFALTTADEFFKIRYPKADTPQGRAVLREVADRGHVIGVHAGGEYKTQNSGHDERVIQPPYSLLGQDSSEFNNALESDLYECVSTIESITGRSAEFVRPPLWRYSSRSNPEIQKSIAKAYQRYGLKMILTDAKFPDGGYFLISIIAVQKYPAFRNNLKRAFLSGEDNLIISMHDSNAYTANDLGNILNMIPEEFEKVEFAGFRGNAGDRLDFADTYSDVVENLSSKRRYTMFPSYNQSVDE